MSEPDGNEDFNKLSSEFGLTQSYFNFSKVRRLDLK